MMQILQNFVTVLLYGTALIKQFNSLLFPFHTVRKYVHDMNYEKKKKS